MRRRLTLVGLAAGLLAGGAGCATNWWSKEHQAANRATWAYVDRLPQTVAADPERWGLRDTRFIGLGLTRPEFPRQAAADPSHYESRVWVWCRGTTPDGREVTRRRQLLVTVELARGYGPLAPRYRVVADDELTLGRQFLAWVVLTYTAPVLVALVLAALAAADPTADRRFLAGHALLGTGWAAVCGYQCFGFGWAAAVAAAVYAGTLGGLARGYAATRYKRWYTAGCVAAAAGLGGWYWYLCQHG